MPGTKNTTDLREFFSQLAIHRRRFVARRHAYYDDLHRLLAFAIPPDTSVIELGCGIGNVLVRLPNAQKVGIDFAPDMIEEAKNFDQTGTQYRIDDIEHLQEQKPYDYILLLDTVNSLRDVQHAFTEIRTKLCDNQTRLIITFHNFLWRPLLVLWERIGLKTPLPEQNWLAPADIKTLLHLAGFELVSRGERMLWPWATPMIATLCNRFLVRLPMLRRLALSNYVIARPLPTERKDYSVSIVIPARNEEGNIERAIEELPTFGTTMQIIFVEGNSTDNTWMAIESMKHSYHGPHEITIAQQDGKGKGDAVRKGFGLAHNDILFILDADLTVAPADLPKFYDAIASGKGEFINGSRLVYPMEQEAMRTLNLLGNKFFSLLFTWLLGQRLKDTLCGTKVFRKTDYERIVANRSYFGDFDPFGDFDLLFGAAKQNLKILEVPIRYRERTYGTTNISRFRHGWLLLQMCAVAAMRLKFF